MANRFAAINAKEPEQPQIEVTPKVDIGRPVSRTIRGPGRPATGKRSDPAFEKVGVYLDAATRKKAERKWEDEGKGDLSDLIGKLLTDYLGDR